MVAARLLPADAEGRQRVDRYELVGELASGGMATVYLARRAGVGGFQRFVAIKRLHRHLAEETEFVEMFLDEARLAAMIHHPNVISITEVGASERGYYLVMDYVEGDTLARLMNIAAEQSTMLPIGVGLRIVIDMLTGLHAAHEQHDEQGEPLGLVHRDVSPQNVLVGTDGISRLSDFGVARAATRLAGTRVGQLKGKIAYMSPEQAAADENIDRRADVFAGGIVLWEVLTGRRLFKSLNDAATLARVVTDRIEPPVSIVEGLDTRISDICMKALERPLARRYQTAAQFADQLEQAASRRGTLASGREVAAYMQRVLGGEITQQREAVRRWVAVSEPALELTPSGHGRTSGSQLRTDRSSYPPSLPENSSPSRRSPSAFSADSGPNDVTMVAPPPRRSHKALVVSIAAVGVLGLGVGLGSYAQRPRTTDLASGTAISVIGQVPAQTAKGEGIGRAVNTTAQPEGEPTAQSFATVPAGAPAPSASNGAKSTRPIGSAASAKPNAGVLIPDVDLTNPYR